MEAGMDVSMVILMSAFGQEQSMTPRKSSHSTENVGGWL